MAIRYEHPERKRIAFPLGGLGAGMICLEGTGAMSHFSLHNRPGMTNEPCIFAAVHLAGVPGGSRVIEGQVPAWKVLGLDPGGSGLFLASGGLPRFEDASFEARFPFGIVRLADDRLPLSVTLTGWSPFIPGNADDSSLPAAMLEYKLVNTGSRKLKGTFSVNAANFLSRKQGNFGEPPDSWTTGVCDDGFVFRAAGKLSRPYVNSAFAAVALEKGVKVNAAWLRGHHFDALTKAWSDIENNVCRPVPPPADGAGSSPGASLFVPFSLAPAAHRTIRVVLAWYTPSSDVISGDPARRNRKCRDEACGCGDAPPPVKHHAPWYSVRFAGVEDVLDYVRRDYTRLRRKSEAYTTRLFSAAVPPEVLDAVSANLSILKSPTLLRDPGGRLWGWEGCSEKSGCCSGSCTHVWNYAQSIPHLFPALERTLRETEFLVSTNENGYQGFRANLPIEPVTEDFLAAADGQLGGLLKLYRDFQICGDRNWLKRLWPNARRSLDYCIETFDPRRQGYLEEPHHNTYDIEFWGPDSMCTGIYLGALKAACLMGRELGDDTTEYARLYADGRRFMETELFNGEFFIQQVKWKGLRAGDYGDFMRRRKNDLLAPEVAELVGKEGPKYQYGGGCLADGVLGAWLAEVCGVGEILDPARVRSHLESVYRYNFKSSLKSHANPQRAGYGLGGEGGVVLCTWPRGGRPALPFPYSDEVWTGVEYQVASHMIMMGMRQKGLRIVKAVRRRYDGSTRNPFDEYECGHWYARAMSSYALLLAFGRDKICKGHV